MEFKFWSLLCTALMLIAIVLELLTPTMGGFTVVALGLAVGSVYLGFRDSPSFGYIMVAANLTLFPLGLWLGVHFMRRSPLLNPSEILGGSQDAPEARPLTHLLGQEGRALTPLRPGGAALIGEARIDVVTEGKFVDPETRIRVIKVEGNKVVVEPLA